MYQSLRVLKDEFRRWYGALSIDEIMGNPTLIKAIESTEKVISSLESRGSEKIKGLNGR